MLVSAAFTNQDSSLYPIIGGAPGRLFEGDWAQNRPQPFASAAGLMRIVAEHAQLGMEEIGFRIVWE